MGVAVEAVFPAKLTVERSDGTLCTLYVVPPKEASQVQVVVIAGPWDQKAVNAVRGGARDAWPGTIVLTLPGPSHDQWTFAVASLVPTHLYAAVVICGDAGVQPYSANVASMSYRKATLIVPAAPDPAAVREAIVGAVCAVSQPDAIPLFAL